MIVGVLVELSNKNIDKVFDYNVPSSLVDNIKLGVRVVGVAPGILEATGLRTLAYEEALAYTRGVTVEQIRAGYTSTKTTPLGRDGKLSEVADLVAYIASDRASYVHGVTYNVAGGKTRG